VMVDGAGGCNVRWRSAIVDVRSGRVVARGPAGQNALALLGGFVGAAFTRDGRFTVASSGAGLTILPRPGTRGRARLVRHCYVDDPGGLSPVGERVAMACGPDEGRLRLAILDLANGRGQELGDQAVVGHDTAWSADGRRLAMAAAGGLGLFRDGVLLRVVPTDTVDYRVTGLDYQGDVSLTATYIPPD
jgi:hypothetical protein